MYYDALRPTSGGYSRKKARHIVALKGATHKNGGRSPQSKALSWLSSWSYLVQSSCLLTTGTAISDAVANMAKLESSQLTTLQVRHRRPAATKYGDYLRNVFCTLFFILGFIVGLRQQLRILTLFGGLSFQSSF